MDLARALEPVLDAARENASDVDTNSRFPHEAVAALRESGLCGLTVPSEAGGMGCGPEELVTAVARIAAACGSTAMVYLMHVSATMTVAAAPPSGQPKLLEQLADGTALGTLAFSETGSRSHFWAPTSQARADGATVELAAPKSFVTSAGHADVYIVSTLQPAATSAESPGVDIYAIPGDRSGVTTAGSWQGLGLRGNASAPMRFELETGDGDRLGAAGGGFALMLEAVLPWFNLGNAAVSLGFAKAAVDAAIRHASGARLEHLDESLAQLPTIRAQLSRMSLDLAATEAYLGAAARSIAAPDDATTLHVLGAKAYANDAALRITDAAMRVCGGAAFSHHLQLERFFRDARAGSVMAPTADVLYDLYGRALAGLALFEN
ncbi:acyl-CoA dehydrogenase [Actinobacteria bacterium YIM 96077]|uniref:Acyl-CoA dehydrogenase n=1 Tax=Phytoactinopolyspora halophila TaxID=1981511 RepID=A0A329QQB9_9ACTN|nr:acyl-CoA dehydrogenase family protein [Phytoactinopolyspora halophila]AYY14519.1 acyl-CoA dehydrogenase [Actinobacteria bacterium YIM 96077]RAW14101.1 acyl-CoA dehydrogenase [Phytoactinopolyspora halophila]